MDGKIQILKTSEVKELKNCSGDVPRKPKIDLTVGHRQVTKELCEFCREKPPVKVIMNPNRFPENDENIPTDWWDVCETCRDYVNKTMAEDHARMLDAFVTAWNAHMKKDGD